MGKKLLINITLLLLYAALSTGQEVVTGLQTNRILLNNKNKAADHKGIAADTLELPFFDDFSYSSFIPDPLKWSDNFAFINNTYSDKQITVGMATLDALDEFGKLYETASSEGFEADHLTSQPINLNFASSENIYLSFYYQPKGLADPPGLQDSLILQFYSPVENKWHSVWKGIDTLIQRFNPVIIRIDDPIFLKKGFKFRFVNWATISKTFLEWDPAMVSNFDQWNIDYVYLDRNRHSADTILTDVAFRTPLRSILKTYEAMPWNQFKQAYLQEMGSYIPIHYRNNDVITRNVTRNFVIRDMYTGAVSHSFSAGATNIEPLTNVDYNANLIYTFNINNNDSALFKITSYLITDDFDPKENDTVTFYQVFGNYFAYDDGTSEYGYGINGQGTRNAMLACRFKSYLQDTIRAISICFNNSYLNSNQRAFDLVVWDDNNGLPGNIIYSVEDMIVKPGNEINGFTTYVLPDGVMVNGIFYIGWKQHSEIFLNVGVDLNTPPKNRQFRSEMGKWTEVQPDPDHDGTIMIRPIVGPPLKTTSSDDIITPEVPRSFRMWPNPATNHINLDGDLLLSGSASISIIDLYGREMMRVPYSERIDISPLKQGLYTVIILSNGRRSAYSRLVITK